MPFIKAALVAEVLPGKGKEVQVGGKKLALFHAEDSYYAIDSVCPHRGAPLAEGECFGAEVECPWHAARFDLTTGAALCPPASRGVNAYKVQVVGDEIQIEM